MVLTNRTVLTPSLFLFVSGLIGCAVTVPAVENPIAIGTSEYGRLFDATQLVLRDHGFRIARSDYRFGKVTTKPVGSPTIVEVWQSINSTAGHAWASTIGNQRRQITITFEPADPLVPKPTTDAVVDDGTKDAYVMRAEVIIERLMKPTARLTGSTTGRRLIGELAAVPAEWTRRGIKGAYWRPIGRDPHLEQRLLRQIVSRSLKLPDDQISSDS